MYIAKRAFGDDFDHCSTYPKTFPRGDSYDAFSLLISSQLTLFRDLLATKKRLKSD